MAVVKPIVFRIGNGYYGVDISCVNAIEKDQSVVSVPNTSSSIQGIINLRGEVIPVYSLRAKFNLPPCPNNVSYVIAQLETMKLAIVVDEVHEISNITEDQVNPFPRIALTNETRFFRNVINVDGKLILTIDINDLLDAEDEERAKQLMEEK